MLALALMVSTILVAGADGAARSGPRVLDHERLRGTLDVYLLADRRGFYVVELVDGSEADALDVLEHVEPLDEGAALALFDEVTNPRTPFGADP